MRRVRWATLALSGSLLLLSGCCWNFGWFSRRAVPCCECDPCCCGSPGAVAGFEGPVLAQPEPFMAPGALPPPAAMFPGTAPPPVGTPVPTAPPPPRIVPIPQAPTTPYTPTGLRKWRRW